MAKATRFLSIFAVFFVLFLVLLEVPNIEANDRCKKLYKDYPPMRCLALIYPSLCYYDCKRDKGALSGTCIPGENIEDTKCICDFCSDPYFPPDIQNIMQAKTA